MGGNRCPTRHKWFNYSFLIYIFRDSFNYLSLTLQLTGAGVKDGMAAAIPFLVEQTEQNS